MQKSILDAFPKADIAVGIVWVDILTSDDLKGARESAAMFTDTRVRQFHDPNWRAARVIAKVTKMPAMLDLVKQKIVTRERLEANFNHGFVAGPPAAFDAFLFYEAEGKWDQSVGQPMAWLTQLDPLTFIGIDPKRFFWDQDLVDELKRTMKRVMDESTTAPSTGSDAAPKKR